SEHAAECSRASRVTVLERVAGAVDAGTFAVPQREHARVARAGEQVRLLRAPDRGRREVLVQAGLEANARRIEMLLCAPELAVETAERRAAVARHEARGVETRQAVAVALREQQAHERLQSGDEEGVRFEAVPFIES